jgi:hypothetical protein
MSAIVKILGDEVVAFDPWSKKRSRRITKGVAGTADATVILAALAASNTVLLADGSYASSVDIPVPENGNFIGESSKNTSITFTGSHSISLLNMHSRLANMSVLGSGHVRLSANHIVVEDVRVTSDADWSAAFLIYLRDYTAGLVNNTVEDIEFRNCVALDCGRPGFLNYGADAPNHILGPSDEIVGVDMGIKNFAVLSNGEFIENPRFLLAVEHVGSERTKREVPIVHGGDESGVLPLFFANR